MASNSQLWDVVRKIDYSIGETVVLNYRKNNGYPKKLDFGIDYFVIENSNDFLTITDEEGMGNTFNSSNFIYKIHKIYFLPKYLLRQKKIDSLFNS